jgi:pyruvate,water dikinase
MPAPDVPDGFWQLEATENPQPISPMAGSFFLDAMNAGMRHLCAEAGLLLDGAEWRAIGGWVYLQAIPFSGDEKAVAERLARGVDAVHDDLAGRYLDRWHAEWRPWVKRRAREIGAVDRTVLNDTQLDDHLQEVLSLLLAATDVHILLHGSNALMLAELVFACRDLLKWDEQRVFDLLSGSSVASTEPARRLAELADMARSRPAVRALLDDPAHAVTRISSVDPHFAAAFAAYLAEFGDRAVRYEVMDPTIGECPALLLRLIRDQIAAEYDPAAVATQVAGRQAEAKAEARATLAERWPAERQRFERLLDRAAQFYPVREDNEVWTVSVPLGLTRRALLEVGTRLAATNAIADRDDVFFLHLDETYQALREGTPALDTVTVRRAEHAWAAAHPGPPSYGTPPPEPDFTGLPPAARLVHEAIGWLVDRIVAPTAVGRRQTGPTIEGLPASAGRYTGPARIVRRESDLGKLRPGDVLVCPTTSPVWAVIFPTVSALVTDSGGIISHHAIIAREFAIPAVVGTGNATELLVDGQTVTVDGDRGRVEFAP